MSARLFAFPLLAVTLGLSAPTASAQPYPPHDFEMPWYDLEKWEKRLKQFCPREGWTVYSTSSDVVLQRNQPVQFARHIISMKPRLTLPDSPKPVIHTEAGVFRLRLRFSRLMSLDKYEQLAAENAPAEWEKRGWLEYYNLKEILGVFVQYSYTPSMRFPESPEALESSVKGYHEATKDLIFKPLPSNYAPDYSVTFYQSWKHDQYVYSGEASVDRECNGVAEAISSYFGSYTRKDGMAKIPFGLVEESAK